MSDLIKTYWQHTVKNTSVENFRAGDPVFLRSAPRVSMTVLDTLKLKGTVKCYVDSTGMVVEYLPEQLLHYFHNCLINDKYERFYICLN